MNVLSPAETEGVGLELGDLAGSETGNHQVSVIAVETDVAVPYLRNHAFTQFQILVFSNCRMLPE